MDRSDRDNMPEKAPKILFIDDEQSILRAYQRGFRKTFDLDVAGGAEEGLEKINTDGPFAVVVSDFKMPGMNGVELLRAVKESSPDTIRIMLTGYADLTIATDAINKGDIFRFLTKPISITMLEETILAGLHQHRLTQDRRELHALRKIKKSMEGIILGFTQIIETRDPYTAGHQRRVARLSTAIAEKMGLTEDQCTGLRLAALVHDLGKVAVPFEYLNKPGVLTELEFDIIKTHPGVARDILQSVDFAWPISEIVFQHHERLDGSGYPQGLKGGDILVEAGIIAVADVVEAVSSHRPYRPSRGLETALDEIKTNSGVLYRPEVVEACLDLFENDGLRLV